MIYSCAVWGKKYCNLYIKYALPSHLAKNNADYLTKNDQYVIFTNESGKELLNKSPQLRILAQYVTIKWKITKKKRLEWKDMTNFHKMVIDYSQKKDTGCVFLGPDFIISQGTIKRIKELVSGGKKLILAPGLRTDYEKFTKKIKRHIKRSQLSISNIKLANHIAQCMHRITKSQFLNSSRFTFWPSAIINSDTNSGNYCIQSLHIHPIYAKPENTRNQSQFDSIDGEFLESFINEKKNIYISQSSEDIILAEISESKKTLAEPNSRNLFKLTNFAKFIVDFSNELHRYVFNKPYYLITKATGQLPKPIKFPRELYAFFLLKKKIVQSIFALCNYLNRRMSRIIEKEKKYLKINGKMKKIFFYRIIRRTNR
jgi:hypothetical protein